MSIKNADLPAIPNPHFESRAGVTLDGLTKREIFAMAAMQGIMGNPSAEPVNDLQFKNIAEDAVRAADVLLAELEKVK